MTDRNQLTLASSAKAASKPLLFKVVSQAADYPAPTVREATDGILMPFDARNGATVVVTYPTMNNSHKIIVRVTGHNQAASFLSEEHAGSDTRTITVTVPAHVIGANQGHTPLVRYEVILAGQKPKESGPLGLRVSTLHISRLPTPEVPQAKDGVLDLSNFDGNASIKVLEAAGGYVWPLWGVGQTYWVLLKGTLENGGDYERYLANPGTLEDAQGTAGLTLDVPRAQLEGLKDGSALEVILNVGYDGDWVESKALAFPVLKLTLGTKREFEAPNVPEASQGKITELDKGANIVVPATAKLRQGEYVRGRMGRLETEPLEVVIPGAALPIPVSTTALWNLASLGPLEWSYEVKINGTWQPSDSISIAVITVAGREDWSTVPPQKFALNRPLTFPSGITATLLVENNYIYYTGIYTWSNIHGLMISGESTVKLTFPNPIRNFSAAEIGNEKLTNEVWYYNNDKLLYTQNTPPSREPFNYSAPAGERITHIHLVGKHMNQPGYWTNNLTWS